MLIKPDSWMKTPFISHNAIVLDRAGMRCMRQASAQSAVFQVLLMQKCSNYTQYILQGMYTGCWQQLETANEFHLQSLVSPLDILCQLHRLLQDCPPLFMPFD